jgi:hypothetical protein
MRKAGFTLFWIALMAQAETLQPKTLQEFDVYMKLADQHMSANPKLWVEQGMGRREEALKGRIVTSYYAGREPRKVSSGLVHDWVGTVFVPRATMDDGLKVLRDYNRHAQIYAPDVISSKLISSAGGEERTVVRFLKKKIITVVLEGDFVSRLRMISPAKAQIEIRSTRVSEVRNSGESDEEVMPPDTGNGFLWRLHSWYTLEERRDGLWVQLRAVSLTRDIPFGLSTVIGPMVNGLPRESLAATLDKTRTAIQALR